MPRDVQGLGKLQINTLPVFSWFELSRFPKPDVFLSHYSQWLSPPSTWIGKPSTSATSFDQSPTGLALMSRTVLLLLILWPHSYQPHWPLILVLREAEQSLPIHLLHAICDFTNHCHVPLTLFLLPCWKISDYSIVPPEEAIPYIRWFLLSLVQPWSYTVEIYPSLSCSLLLLLLFPSSAHQIANFWARQHFKMDFFSQKVHQLATEIRSII